MRARVPILVVICMATVLSAGVALATVFEPGWPLPGPGPVVLGFGESYMSADGSTSVHRGVDIASPAGSAVTGVLDGTVTFAGRVPAGEGATTIAVTVESGDVRLTYMPLSEASVACGEPVMAGARLGMLAASGDRSSADAHLHLGARRGSLYIDPMPFLKAPVAPAGGGVPEPEPVPAMAQPVKAAPSAVPAPAASPITAIQVQPLPAVGVAAPSPAALGQSVSVGSGGQATVAGGAHSPAVSGNAQSRDVVSTDARSESVVADARPARALSNMASVIPDAGLAGLAVDRRAEALRSAPLPVAAIVAIAAMLGIGLLWPIWRSVPALSVAVTADRQDVAAVVSR
jgi:hypothetical protein